MLNINAIKFWVNNPGLKKVVAEGYAESNDEGGSYISWIVEEIHIDKNRFKDFIKRESLYYSWMDNLSPGLFWDALKEDEIPYVINENGYKRVDYENTEFMDRLYRAAEAHNFVISSDLTDFEIYGIGEDEEYGGEMEFVRPTPDELESQLASMMEDYNKVLMEFRKLEDSYIKNAD